jgi:flagella basal body P-ring formation protein FlgA
LVAKKEIDRGEVITADNLRIQAGVTDYPDTANRDGWARATLSAQGEPQVPTGLIARRLIPKDTVLRAGMIGPVEPPVLVKRRQTVVIRFEQFGLTVTAVGLAEQEGRLGEMIKVRNVDSKRIIVAEINADGTVSPVL